MNASEPEWRERFPVLFMTETEVLEAAAANPVVDLIEAAMSPDSPGRPLSPGARAIPEISEALDRAREMLITEHESAPGDFIVSNCGRDFLPDGRWSLNALEERTQRDTFLGAYNESIAQGLTEDEATAVGRAALDELAARWNLYNELVELADYGGSPITTFVLYSPRDQGVVEYLVPEGWSRRRAARYLCRKVRDCFFCPHFGSAPDVDIWLLVDCGAVTRAMPACDDCARRLAGPEWENFGSIDWLHAWNLRFFQAGCPDDQYV